MSDSLEDDEEYSLPFPSEAARDLFERYSSGSFVPETEEQRYENWKQRYPNIPENWTDSEDSHENIVRFFMDLAPEDSASLSPEFIEAAVYYPYLHGYPKALSVKLAAGSFAKLNNELINYLLTNSGVSVDTIMVEAILLIQLDRFDLAFEDLTKIVLENAKGIHPGWLDWIEYAKSDYRGFHN